MEPTTAPTTAPTSVEIPDAVGTSFQWMIDQLVDMASLVFQNPVLCLGVAIWAAGATIGLFKRLV